MKYIRYFESQNAYNDVSANLSDPTIVLYKNDNDNNAIIYKDDNKYLIVGYNITDISTPSTLFNIPNNTEISYFVHSVEVDNQDQPLAVTEDFSFDYQFNTTGYHFAKIYLKPTWQGNIIGINFQSNTNIISLRIPKQIETVSGNLCYHCTNLTDVIIDKNSAFTTILSHSFEGCTSLKNINLGNAKNITTITFNCFNSTGIENLVIPDNIVTLEQQAFNNAKSLKTIYASLNSKLSTIDRSVFGGCTNLEYVHLPNTVTSFGDDCFIYCQKIEGTIDLKHCTTIGASAFKNCNKLQFKNINKVSNIGGSAFQGTSIQTAELKENTSLGIQIFNDCANLETLIFDGDFSMTNWNQGLAQNCPKLTSVIFKKPITKLPSNCFQGASSLKTIDLTLVGELLPNGIGNQLRNMESCILPPNITHIPEKMFAYWDNTNLVVTLPATVTEIDNQVFQSCRGTFYILAVTPPTLSATSAINNNMTIYVPAASLEAYKAAEYWSGVANRIFAITE